jgi:hypothetical protein
MYRIVHIIIDPDYEVATNVWHNGFIKYYYNKLQERADTYDDYVFVHLHYEKAVWSQLVATLNEFKDEFNVDDGVAHGADNLKVGYNNTLLHAIDEETAQIAPLIGLFKETSCNVGRALCPYLSQKGVKWTIGNTEPMYLVSGSNDEIKSFLLPEIESVLNLHSRFHEYDKIKGSEFYSHMLFLYDQEISRWGNSSVAYYLKKNRDYRQLWDTGFILEKKPPSPPPQPPKRKFKVTLQIMSDLTGYWSIGRVRVPIWIYSKGKNIEGIAEEIEEQS